MSILERCPSCRQSNKGSKKRVGAFWFCKFFGLIFVSKGVPRGLQPIRGTPGCLEDVPRMLRGVPGVSRGVPGLFQVLKTPSLLDILCTYFKKCLFFFCNVLFLNNIELWKSVSGSL